MNTILIRLSTLLVFVAALVLSASALAADVPATANSLNNHVWANYSTTGRLPTTTGDLATGAFSHASDNGTLTPAVGPAMTLNRFALRATDNLTTIRAAGDANWVPGSNPAANTGFPTFVPAQVDLLNSSMRFQFTYALPTGSIVWVNDLDINENIGLQFFDCAGTLLNPSAYDTYLLSTTNLPVRTFAATQVTLRDPGTGGLPNPTVGIIIRSAAVCRVQAVHTTGVPGGNRGNAAVFFSMPTARLTIRKNVTNDNGGTATAANFGLATTAGTLNFGANTGTAQNAVYTAAELTVIAGTYTLRENDIAAYAEGTWSCTNVGTGNFNLSNNTIAAGSITLEAGNNVTCEITNNDAAPSLRITKVSRGGVGTFAFTGTNGIPNTSITTVTPNAGVRSAFFDLTAANVATTITETPQAGWQIINPAGEGYGCYDANSGTPNTPFGTFVGNELRIPAANIRSGASITCFILNQRATTVTVTKVSNGGTGTFGFTGSNGIAAHNITTTAAGGAGTAGAQQTLTAAGTQTTITEDAPPAGYALTDIACTGLGAGGTATRDLAARTITLNAAATAAGSGIACTFTNTRLPTVTVTKVSNGGTGTFGFTGSNGIAAHNITTTAAGTGVAGAQQTLVAAGTQTTITEDAPPAGYALTDIACTGLGAGGTATRDLAARTITLNAAAMAAGSAIACTFTNQASAAVTLKKTWTNGKINDAVNLAITGGSGATAGSSIAGGASVDAMATASVGATVTLAESFTTGEADNYTTTLACVDASNVTVPVTGTGLSRTITMPATAVTCTYTNTLRSADLSITKSNGVGSVVGGGQTTYTVTVNNNGTNAVTGAVVRDTPVTGLSNCAVTQCAPAGACPASNDDLLSAGGATLGTLAAGASVTFTLKCDVAR